MTVLPILGVRVVVRNPEKWRGASPLVVVANHQSMLDFFFLGGIVPDNTITLVKRGLRFIPLFGGLYTLSGNLLVHRNNPIKAALALESARRRMIKDSVSLLIFPEGTRSLGRGMGSFRRGAFHLAIETGFPVLPIAVSSYYGRLDFRRWFSGTVVIEVMDPISTVGMSRLDKHPLRERVRSQIDAAISQLDATATQVPCGPRPVLGDFSSRGAG
jgi:1-acyl-sn-glycerol-3-phosphate acyltransferase